MTLQFFIGGESTDAVIPSNVIFMWPGTNGSIPAGWTRQTSLDARNPKGTAAGVNPDVIGGAATHTHTATATHSHTLASHTHGGTTSAANSPFSVTASNVAAGTSHTHTYTSGAQTGTGPTAITSSWASSGNQPDFFRVIFIQSNGTPTGVPDTGVAFKNSSTLPTSWIQHVASKSRFMLGAVAAGDGGGTGGDANHSHAAGAAHTHLGTVGNHQHGSVTGGSPSTTSLISNPDGASGATSTHTHVHSFDNSGSVAAAAATGGSSGTTNYEPSFYTLFAIQNNKGSADWPGKLIGLWLGTLAAIPTNWLLCDGTSGTPDLRDRFIKCANVAGDLGVTGGSNGHTHTAGAAHSHTASHTHVQATAATATSIASANAGGGGATSGHPHANAATDSAGVTSSDTTPIDDSSDSQPVFRTVAFIEGPTALSSLIAGTGGYYEV